MPLLSENVWVEAERDGTRRGAVVLSVKDVRTRRKLVDEFGEHNVWLPASEMVDLGFPLPLFPDLARGRPVRFKMSFRDYKRLLTGKSRLNGLGDGALSSFGRRG